MSIGIGTRFTPTLTTRSKDVTVGKEYAIVGRDRDGDLYFIDDVGERNFAMCDDGNLRTARDRPAGYTLLN